jgi:hypothetical protein
VAESIHLRQAPLPDSGPASRACSRRGHPFDGAVRGSLVIRRSATPFCDAARSLLAAGADPATRLVMRHAGQDHDALRSTVGATARLTVTDADKDGRPRFKKWMPNEFHGSKSSLGAPPMRGTEVAATGSGPGGSSPVTRR